MGYMRHHAIVLTCDKHNAKTVKNTISKIFGIKRVPQFDARINGYTSFFIPPDGSKEGWEESIEGDKKRGQLKKWLRSKEYSDGSTSFPWAEVQYGDEDGDNRIIDCSK